MSSVFHIHVTCKESVIFRIITLTPSSLLLLSLSLQKLSQILGVEEAPSPSYSLTLIFDVATSPLSFTLVLGFRGLSWCGYGNFFLFLNSFFVFILCFLSFLISSLLHFFTKISLPFQFIFRFTDEEASNEFLTSLRKACDNIGNLLTVLRTPA